MAICQRDDSLTIGVKKRARTDEQRINPASDEGCNSMSLLPLTSKMMSCCPIACAVAHCYKLWQFKIAHTQITREVRAKVEYTWIAMAEWLILLLLVPAIVVPAVLLVGFAGCSFEHGSSSPGFETTFDETGAFSRDGSGWEGFTLVQRIEAAGLNPTSRTFAKVKITLFASTVSNASIDRIFISGPASTKEWDSDSIDLTEVPLPNTPFVMPAGMSVTLDPVDYSVRPPSSDGTDPGRALLIAVDFSIPPTASGVRTADQVPPDRAVAWWFQYYRPPPQTPLPPEAGVPDGIRSAGYTSSPNVYLIGKIEIA
jgi:hypothetical protein